MIKPQYFVAQQFPDGATYVESPRLPMSRKEAVNLLQVCRRNKSNKYILLQAVEGV